MMDKLDKALQLYEKTFDDSFPTIPLLMGNSEDEVVEMFMIWGILNWAMFNTKKHCIIAVLFIPFLEGGRKRK